MRIEDLPKQDAINPRDLRLMEGMQRHMSWQDYAYFEDFVSHGFPLPLPVHTILPQMTKLNILPGMDFVSFVFLKRNRHNSLLLSL